MIKFKSLAFKLIVFFSGSCSLILLGIFLFNFQFSKKIILADVEESARNLTLRAVNRIDAIALAAQKIPKNMANFLEHGAMGENQILSLLRMLTVENEDITGVSVMFEPYAFKKDLLSYGPYCFEVNGELKFTNSPGYFLDDFYQIPKELDRPAWSEPYVDQDAKILEATFSHPFYENALGKRKLKGIVTADISLEWLQGMVSSIKVLETGDAFLISQNGTIITHPRKELIMNETIFSVAEARGDPVLREIGRKMVRGESGFVPFTSLGRNLKSWMCYTPIPSTGWSLGVIFPENEFMADITRLNRIVAGLGLAGLGLLVFVIVVISRSITRPLRGMAKAAGVIGRGDLDAPLPPVASGDEVGKLAGAFGYMQSSLKQYIRELKETTAAKERIESELKIAHEIQASMLPRIFPPFPDRKEFDLFAVMEPAKEVGGDFFDFFLVENNKIFFLIGDVSGKGVPAALFMMITKILMKNEALQGLSPAEVLSKVNNIVARDNDSSMFATIFCAVLDTETGEIEFSNAGHNPPLLCRKGQASEFLRVQHGFVLGPIRNSKFAAQKIRLAPDDMLFLYTDGVTEAMNPQKQLFSEHRLQQALAGLQDTEAMKTIQGLKNEIKLFAKDEPQSDDITMLALRFKGK